MDKDIKQWVFIPGLCRSLWLTYQGESNVGKIKTWDYRPPYEVFDMENEDNYCYCPKFFECADEMTSKYSVSIVSVIYEIYLKKIIF